LGAPKAQEAFAAPVFDAQHNNDDQTKEQERAEQIARGRLRLLDRSRHPVCFIGNLREI
jgi:hypothetical protein